MKLLVKAEINEKGAKKYGDVHNTIFLGKTGMLCSIFGFVFILSNEGVWYFAHLGCGRCLQSHAIPEKA